MAVGFGASQSDYYAVLGLSPVSDDVVIRAAFKALMLKYHPDTNKSADATQRAAAINGACRLLRRIPPAGCRPISARPASSRRAPARPHRDSRELPYCAYASLSKVEAPDDEAPFQDGNSVFSRSTVWRHLGVFGAQTLFWLPNMPTSWIAASSPTVATSSTGTKYSQRSRSSMNSR